MPIKSHKASQPSGGVQYTELCEEPKDWVVDRLSTNWDVIDCKHITADFVFSGVPVVSIREVQGRFVDVSDAKQTTDKFYAELTEGGRKPQPGDLILSRNATVGEVAQVAGWHPPFAMGQDVCLLRKRSPDYSSDFLQSVFKSEIIARQLENMMVGSTFRRVNVQQVKALVVPFPPAQEQRAIAETLSDVDGLLGALEALIAKKRAMKQAAMQQLLTGKTRLPGFSGPWEIVAPDDIATRITGFWGSNESTDATPHRMWVIRAGDISPLGVLTGSAVRYFSDAELAKAACHEGDVVITVSGNGLGKTWLVEDRAFLAASNFVRILRQKHGRAHGPFLAAALNGGDAQRLLTEHTATSAYPNLRPTFFSTRWLALPSLDEQTAIATVLSDMDAEIAALERRRDKTRAIKQGMMQQLLTGRVRLVKPEVAA